MKIIKKYKSILITTIFSTLIFLGNFSFVGAETSPSIFSIDSIKLAIANIILGLAATILGLAGTLFNFVISYTLNFKEVIENVGVVNIGWEIMRDLSNMAFIFILLAISIATILGIEKYNAKTLLKQVIIVALFINFSLFITNVIIDTANVFTVGFYNAITEDVGSGGTGNQAWDKGISNIFAQSLNLETVYAKATLEKKPVENILTMAFMGSIFLLVTAFVFFAAAILFMKRMIFLMFLMILSPFAFLGSILPATQSHAKNWWKTLFTEAFYAPIFMMFIYIVARGITSEAYQNTIGAKNTGFDNIVTGTSGSGVSFVIFNFILIIGLMIASIVSASKLGATGAKGMMGMGKGLKEWGTGRIKAGAGAGAGAATFGATGRLGRRVIGGVASKTADWAKDKEFATNSIGKFGVDKVRKLADASFDVRNIPKVGKALGLGTGIKGGYKTKVIEQEKKRKEYAKFLGDVVQKDDSGKVIMDPTTGKPKTKKGSEIYAKNIGETRGFASVPGFIPKIGGKKILPSIGGRSIMSSILGTTEADQQVSKALLDIPKAEEELKIAQNKLKDNKNKEIKKARHKLRVIKDEIKDIREVDKIKPSPALKESLYKAEDEVKDMEAKIKEEIEKAKEKLKKTKESVKVKKDDKKKQEKDL